MIELYSGTPGSGKSLHVAEKIKSWVSIWGCPVLCNFAFRVDLCRPKRYGSYVYIDNDDMNPEILIWYSEYYKSERKLQRVPEEEILLVIDECQLLFNCRDWNAKNRKEWISFFSQHRKLGYRIILVAQYPEMIDKQIRALIEYNYIHRKVKNIGMPGKIINFLAMGNLHVAVKIYSPLQQKVGTEFFKGTEVLYKLYDSYNRFN